MSKKDEKGKGSVVRDKHEQSMSESIIVKPIALYTNFKKYQKRKERKSVNFVEVIYPINYEMLLILFPPKQLKGSSEIFTG